MAESVTKKVIKESIWKFASTAIAKVGAIIFVIIIARFLNPSGFGIYNLTMSIALIFIAFADVGINQTLIRYVSYAMGNKNPGQASSYMRYLLKIKSLLALFFSAVILILAYPLSSYLFKKPDLFLPLMIVSVYITLISLESFFESLFYALKKTRYLVIKEILSQLLRIGFALIVFFFFVSKFYVMGIILGVVITTLVLVLFLLFILMKTNPEIFQQGSDNIDKKKVLVFLKYLAIGGLSATFFGYIDTIMLGIFLPSSYVGYYSAAFTLVSNAAILVSISVIILPALTQLNTLQMKGAFNKVFQYTCIINLPLIFGTLALGRYIIKFIYGPEYGASTTLLYFLSPLIFSIALSSILVSLFSAREEPHYFAKPLIISAILNIVLNYVFITSFLKISLEMAAIGSALATVISKYLYLSVLSVIATKRAGINFNKNHFIKPLIASLLMFLALSKFNLYISDMTLVLGFFEVIAGIIIYFLILSLLGGIKPKEILSFFR